MSGTLGPGGAVPAGLVSALGPAGTFLVFGLAGLFMILVVIGVNSWLRWQRARQQPRSPEPNTLEASTTYRRYLVAAAWAGGSARDWDYSVRPVLSELVELAMEEIEPAAPDLRAATREHLGDRLWAQVDRESRRSDDRATTGPGRDALLRILDQLEKT